MSAARKTLEAIIAAEIKRIRESFPSEQTFFIIVEIIRALDYKTYLLKHDIEIEGKEWLYEKYRWGWGPAFIMFYPGSNFDDYVPMLKLDAYNREWIDGIIQHWSA